MFSSRDCFSKRQVCWYDIKLDLWRGGLIKQIEHLDREEDAEDIYFLAQRLFNVNARRTNNHNSRISQKGEKSRWIIMMDPQNKMTTSELVRGKCCSEYQNRWWNFNSHSLRESSLKQFMCDEWFIKCEKSLSLWCEVWGGAECSGLCWDNSLLCLGNHP